MKSLSNSNIDIYRACPRKFKRMVVDGEKPVETPSVALDFGTAIHLGLESYLAGEDGMQSFSLMLRQSKAFEKEANFTKHLEIGTILLNKFKKMHMKHFTNVVSEKRVYVNVDGFDLEGTPDVVCDYKGVPSIVDFKTSYTTYNKDLIYTLPQMKMYALMLRKRGIKVDQIVYMIFTKSGEYSIQVLTRKITDEEITSFSIDLNSELSAITTEKDFRKNPKACHEYNRVCPFIKECFPEFGRKDD